MTQKKPEDLRSHRWFGVDTLRAFGHRSRTYEMGFTREDFTGKPVIGIINTWSDTNTCHSHMRQRAEEVKRRVAAGSFRRTARDVGWRTDDQANLDDVSQLSGDGN